MHSSLVVMFVVLAFGLLLIIIIFHLLLNYVLITVCVNTYGMELNACLELWNNQCKSDSECCSNNCYNPGNWATGVCKPGNKHKREVGLQSNACLELWNNQCKSNSECCSNNCYNPGNWATGVCKP